MSSNKESPNVIVQNYVKRYDEQTYQKALEGLEADVRSSLLSSYDDWAKEIYITFRENPADERARNLNADRKICLKLLYDMVREWQEFGFSEEFEMAMFKKFKSHRFLRILAVCLPMDRAQALYKMQHGTNKTFGMPWFSKMHLEENTAYARDFPEEQKQWKEISATYLKDPTFTPPMNGKLFRLMFSDKLALRSHEDMERWSRPCEKAEDSYSQHQQQVSIPEPLTVSGDNNSRQKQDNKAKAIVQEFLDRYNDPNYQASLNRLYEDRGDRDIEDWAKDIYVTLREYPFDERASRLNGDRKVCLALLHDLVQEWNEYDGLSVLFEQAVADVFKTRRLIHILTLGLPMDRAQALYKMKHGTGNAPAGMPWFSKLHLEPNTAYARDYPDEQREWMELSRPYMQDSTFTPPMSSKLFRLLFSDVLELQSNIDLAKWSRPTPKIAGNNNPSRDDTIFDRTANDELPPGMTASDTRFTLLPPLQKEKSQASISMDDMAQDYIKTFQEDFQDEDDADDKEEEEDEEQKEDEKEPESANTNVMSIPSPATTPAPTPSASATTYPASSEPTTKSRSEPPSTTGANPAHCQPSPTNTFAKAINPALSVPATKTPSSDGLATTTATCCVIL